MRLTKEALIKIIKEEYDAYSIESIRERAHTGEMANEVWHIMSSMGASEDEPIFSARDTFDMIYEAANEEDPSDFWWSMLSPDGFLGDAIIGLRQTKDDDYDPDSPYNVPPMEESKREQILKIVKEELAAVLADGLADRAKQATQAPRAALHAKPYGDTRGAHQRLSKMEELAAELAGLVGNSNKEQVEALEFLASALGLKLNISPEDADPTTAGQRVQQENWGKKSYAWHQDGGANDEGFSHKDCRRCGKRTEHEMGRCIPCIDRNAARTQQARERNQPLLDAIAQAGSNSFLQKMERQLNQGRDLSDRQRIVVMQILRGRGVDTAGLE